MCNLWTQLFSWFEGRIENKYWFLHIFKEKVLDLYENPTKFNIIFIVFDLYKKDDCETLSSQDFRKFIERYYKNSFKVFIAHSKNDIPLEVLYDVEKCAKENKGISEVMYYECFDCLMRVIKLYLMKKYKKNKNEINYKRNKIMGELQGHFYSVGKDKEKTGECCNIKIKKNNCLIY